MYKVTLNGMLVTNVTINTEDQLLAIVIWLIKASKNLGWNDRKIKIKRL